MNIALLILGVVLIILSIILITINSNNTYENKIDIIESDKKLNYSELSIKEKRDIGSAFSKLDIDLQKKNYDEELVDFESTKSDKLEKLEEFEEEYQLERSNTKSTGENVTSEIIKMYREGLTSNEIAKKLDRGIREIDIILKVNNISK